MNDSASFEDYRTFSITRLSQTEKSLNASGLDILLTIEKEIGNQMETRGYQPSNSADVIIRYELISEQQSTGPSNQSRYQNFYNPFPTFNTSRPILQSALLLEMYDIKTKDLIWQASVDMDQYAKSKQKEEIIELSVMSIFSTFLYRAGSDTQDETLKSKN